MEIDRKNLWRVVFTSWGYTLAAILLTFIWVSVISLIGVRFVGARTFIIACGSLGALMFAVFVSSEMIVNLLFGARRINSDDENELRFAQVLRELCESKRMWVKPRAYIMEGLDVPNAMAYGMGLPFFSAIAVTPKLLELLDEEELKGVVAHELAHVRCSDVGLMTMMGVLLSVPDKLGRLLKSGGSALGNSVPALALGYLLIFFGKYVLGTLRFAMQQEREFAADALGASYVNSSAPLIKALEKLSQSRREQFELFHDEEKRGGERHPLERLMVSHPGLGERIASLESITKGGNK